MKKAKYLILALALSLLVLTVCHSANSTSTPPVLIIGIISKPRLDKLEMTFFMLV